MILITQIETHIEALRSKSINNEESIELLQNLLAMYTVIENARREASQTLNGDSVDIILQDLIEKLNLSS